MTSIFGDDGVNDLLNENVQEDHELPSDDDEQQNGNENPFGENEEGVAGEDGADPDAVKVEPKKRSVRNPRPRLTVETLQGQRGIQTIEEYYKDIKFKGKGNEKQDLDEVMRRLQHWGHRMYPTYKFDDVLNNIERLGKKKPLQVHMNRYRLGMLENMKVSADGEMLNADDEGANDEVADEPFDEFDALLGEQIAISKLAPRTPASSSAADTHTSTMWSSTLATPSFNRGNAVMSTPHSNDPMNDSDLAQPLPPSQPSTPVPSAKHLTAEQMARMAENRRIALERLQAKKLRLQQQQQNIDTSLPPRT